MDSENKVSFEECPIKLKLDYCKSKLIFRYNYQDIHGSELYYCRSILILDVDSLGTRQDSTDIARIFYNRLSFGHFLKVFYVNYSFKQPWIQKTEYKSDFRKQDERRDESLDIVRGVKAAIRQALKMNEVTDITIITASKQFQDKLPKITKIKEQLQYEYPIVLFLTERSNQTQLYYDYFVKYYDTLDELKNIIKQYLNNKQKVKIASCQIRLKMLTGPIGPNAIVNPYGWKTDQDGVMSKNMYFLKSGREYSENLLVICAQKRVFELQFYAKLMDSRMYLLGLQFSINPQNHENDREMRSVFKEIGKMRIVTAQKGQRIMSQRTQLSNLS